MQPTEVTSPRVMQSAGGDIGMEKYKKEILIIGFIFVFLFMLGIQLMVGLLNAYYIDMKYYLYLVFAIVIENILYQTWKVIMWIYAIYIAYFYGFPLIWELKDKFKRVLKKF